MAEYTHRNLSHQQGKETLREPDEYFFFGGLTAQITQGASLNCLLQNGVLDYSGSDVG